MNIDVNFQTKEIKVDGQLRYRLRRNFHLYDVKTLDNRFVFSGLLKTQIEDAVQKAASCAGFGTNTKETTP